MTNTGTRSKTCALLRPPLPSEEEVHEAFARQGYGPVLNIVCLPGSISVYTQMSECWAVGLVRLMKSLRADDVMAITAPAGLCFEFAYM